MTDAAEPAPPPEPVDINFDTTPTEASQITDIVDRYLDLVGAREDDNYSRKERQLGLRMDLTACHLNGTPLRLQELLDASDFDLAHDVQGIARFMDRYTGKLRGDFGRSLIEPDYCPFRPRFAAPETQQEQV